MSTPRVDSPIERRLVERDAEEVTGNVVMTCWRACQIGAGGTRE